MSDTQAPGGQRSGVRNNKDQQKPSPQWRVEGRRPGDRPPVTPNVRWGRIIFLLVVLLIVNRVLATALLPEPKALRVPYTEFRNQVTRGNVLDVSSSENTIEGHFKKEVEYPAKDGTTGTKFRTERPVFAEGDGLYELLQEKGVVVNANAPDDGPSVLLTLLASFGPTLLIFALVGMAMRRLGSMGGAGIGGLGRSRARRYEAGAQPRTTFEDVAGIDEAEDELVEIVDFLKNPDKYRKLGATIPKGVLLSGPPGTGKTLLAKAVAGEADVPFFSMSASEFVEMIVGVGASRVRDLFNEAKQVAPAILFIDEIDAIGRARGGPSSMGGHDEREQTLNQILTEMDGFTGSEGVIVLAATNRPEILDAALLRPGRFDRRVVVNPPDQVGREAILRVHTRAVPLAPDVDLASLASTTPGMVGADLKNLVNEAALLAARRGHDRVRLGDFTDALEKLVLGTERRIVLSREDRERTAYHESGHALLGMLQPGADPVRKISIVPRGGALGVTFQSPDADRYSYDAAYLRGRIIGALGGRAAEEVVYGDVTTGAESDLEMVTRIARQMVGRWGMSEAIGPLSVLPSSRESGLMMVDSPDSPSQETRELVDKETRRIVEECYRQALEALRSNRAKLDLLVQALLEHETLDEADAYRIAQVPRLVSSASAAAAAAALPSGS